ncbi:hypothetical protein ACT7DH_06065 [Bacillus pacificus]
MQPYLYKGIERLFVFFLLRNAVIRTMKVEEETSEKIVSYKHAITITDFADALTKNYDIPFRHAHHASECHCKYVIGAEKAELHELHLKDVNMYSTRKI